jgi:hypothetical protein
VSAIVDAPRQLWHLQYLNVDAACCGALSSRPAGKIADDDLLERCGAAQPLSTGPAEDRFETRANPAALVLIPDKISEG